MKKFVLAFFVFSFLVSTAKNHQDISCVSHKGFQISEKKEYNFLRTPPPPTTSYYTITNGTLTGNIWSLVSHTGASCACSPDPSCDVTIPSNAIIYISHNVTTACNISIGSNSTIVIENGGSLTVTGNASISGTGFFSS